MTTRKKTASKGQTRRKAAPKITLKKRVTRWLFGAALVSGALVVLLVLLFRFVNPPTGVYMFSESRRLGGVQRDWVPLN